MTQQEAFATDPAELAALAEHGSAVPDDKWPKLLADMLDVARTALARRGLSEEAADEQARTVMLALAKYFGGGSFYLPKGDEIHRALRDDRIWRDFGRLPVEEIARRHGNISLVRAYQIIAEQRALRRKRDQPELF